MNPLIKSKLVTAGVRNLREFGYPSCNNQNITTDRIYAAFFASILKDNLGNGFDDEVNELIAECEAGSRANK